MKKSTQKPVAPVITVGVKVAKQPKPVAAKPVVKQVVAPKPAAKPKAAPKALPVQNFNPFIPVPKSKGKR